MNRMASYNKQNPSNSFYHKSTTDFYPISYKQKQMSSNVHLIDSLIVESESMLEKLKEKISLDEIKIEQNYISLQELSEQMQQSCLQISNNKQIQNIIRQKKQSFRNCLSLNKTKANSIRARLSQQKSHLQETIETKQKQIEQQKQERQLIFSKLIDQFQNEIFSIQKQFKMMKKQQEESSDKVQQLGKEKMEQQRNNRKSQHQTIIKLIGQCIEKFRYVY